MAHIHMKVKKLLMFILICLLSFLGLRFLFLHDNKYTSRARTDGPRSTFLSSAALDSGQTAFLVEGWELYPDILLEPGTLEPDFPAPVPAFIGQYPTFSHFHANGSPYGIMTYHLDIRLDGTPGTYTIFLPEIFSASRIYANGRLIGESGGLKPYSPCIRDLSCNIYLEQNTCLLIQTANYTHYYSGVTYPPSIGTAQSVYRMTGIRMAVYSMMVFSSLAIALFSIAQWAGPYRGRRDSLSLWFAGLSISFSLRVIYPFLHLDSFPGLRILYALEDGTTLAGIWCALNIVCALGHFKDSLRVRFLKRAGWAAMAAGILIPVLVLPDFPAFTNVYGPLVTVYKLAAALVLCFLCLYGRQDWGGLWLMGGTAAYGVSLLLSLLSWNRYEPITGCWPDEYGSYLLVLCFAALMVQRTWRLVKEHGLLTDHLKEEVDRQTRQISSLVDERQKLLSEFLHDLKSPVSSLMTYAGLIRRNNILLDDATEKQLRVIEAKSQDVSRQIQFMQDFTADNPMLCHYQDLDLRNFLETFHRYNQPDVETNGPDFLLSLPPHPCIVRADPGKLKRVLQNLVYNAVSFTPENGTISLSLEPDGEMALITVRDNGCGIPPDIQSRIFLRSFTTRPEQGSRGLGLYIAKTIIDEHGGTITVHSVPGKGTVFYIRIPLLRN